MSSPAEEDPASTKVDLSEAEAAMAQLRKEIEAKYGRNADEYRNSKRDRAPHVPVKAMAQTHRAKASKPDEMASQKLYAEYVKDKQSLQSRTTPGFVPVAREDELPCSVHNSPSRSGSRSPG